jgi:hypothetical protein
MSELRYDGRAAIATGAGGFTIPDSVADETRAFIETLKNG